MNCASFALIELVAPFFLHFVQKISTVYLIVITDERRRVDWVHFGFFASGYLGD